MKIIVRKSTAYPNNFFVEKLSGSTLFGTPEKLEDAIKIAKKEIKRHPKELIWIVKPIRVVEKVKSDIFMAKNQKRKLRRVI